MGLAVELMEETILKIASKTHASDSIRMQRFKTIITILHIANVQLIIAIVDATFRCVFLRVASPSTSLPTFILDDTTLIMIVPEIAVHRK